MPGDFSRKKCEDIVTTMIDHDMLIAGDLQKDIMTLEAIQDKMMGDEYGIDKDISKAAHKEVSALLKRVYELHTIAEQRIYARALELVDCEKGK